MADACEDDIDTLVGILDNAVIGVVDDVLIDACSALEGVDSGAAVEDVVPAVSGEDVVETVASDVRRSTSEPGARLKLTRVNTSSFDPPPISSITRSPRLST